MKIKDISIKWQLIAVCMLLVSIPVIILGVISYQNTEKETFLQIEDSAMQHSLLAANNIRSYNAIGEKKLGSDLNAARLIATKGVLADRKIVLDQREQIDIIAINQNTQENTRITIPTLKINNLKVFGDTMFVDNIKESTDGEATIFQLTPIGLLRISTTIAKQDGTRAIATFIPMDSPVYRAIVSGQQYFGRAVVVGQNFMTAYEPLRDTEGKIVGALFVGQSEQKFMGELFESLAETVVGKTGYIYILNSKGDYVLSLKRQRDGENIWESKDADGNLFIQEIINKAKTLREGESFVTYYPWQNQGEKKARTKLAAITYEEGSDWTIGASAYVDDFTSGLKKIRTSIILVCFIAILIGSGVAYFFALNIAKPITKIEMIVEKISQGNLTENVDSRTTVKELRGLSSDLNSMIKSLTDLLTVVKKNVNETTTSTEKLSSSSEEVNASLEQVSSTIQEISKGAQTLSKNASNAAQKSKLTEDSAKKGAESAIMVDKKMKEISQITLAGAEKIKALGDKSKKIGSIVETINSISEQTNLLALNAAIEAARAGDAGRGFAVVADEVRKLAEESGKATGLISELVNSIQDEINKAVASMEENTKKVGEGTKAVTEALAHFEEIPVLASMMNKFIGEISAIAEENAAGAEEVSASVEEVTSSTQQVVTTIQQLSSEAHLLKSSLERFKLNK
ncbi:methyl-accepting chemotaxis protein [Candidatus Woesearchaeota archaeon]|nr:methyl-accepting chemotaxis protein [Candidatus Woesearchaeota archaeon]